MNDAERYRDEKLESGTRFQDFVVELLFRRRGLAIIQFVSREYQIRRGESLCGVEIKNDEKFCHTGNLWIEVGEKALPRDGEYAPSGILREDNSWLYVIGDYRTVFVFAKRNLVLLYESKRYSVRENDRKTSIGFLFPRVDADRWAAFVEHVSGDDPPDQPPPPPSPASPPIEGTLQPMTAADIRW